MNWNRENGLEVYTHQTRGRLRRDVPGLKYSTQFAEQVESTISQKDGVCYIKTNILTGRVLIIFKPERLAHDELIQHLDKLQSLQDNKARKVSNNEYDSARSVKNKDKKAVEGTEHLVRKGIIKLCTAIIKWLAKVFFKSSMRWQIIQLCIIGAVLLFLFIKRSRSSGAYRLSGKSSLIGLSAVTTIIAGYPIFRNGLAVLVGRGRINIDTLISAATVATIILRESLTGLVVVWLINLSNLLQTITLQRSRKAFEELLSLDEEVAWKLINEVEIRVPVEDVKVHDTVVAHVGEKIIVDGEVVKGEAAINQASITGESNLVTKQPGNQVFAGTIVELGTLYIRAEKVGDDTQLARIIRIVEEAQESRAEIQNIADRFAKKVIPVSFFLSVLIFIITRNIQRSLTTLVIACPCAIGLSTPTAIIAAIGGAARRGILIKGGTHLEMAGRIDSVIFDKTGTLTIGKPRVTRVVSSISQFKPRDVLMFAAIGVKHSTHPLATAILTHVHEMEAIIPEHSECEVVIGHGIRAISDGVQIAVGSRHFMEDLGVKVSHEGENRAMHLAEDGESVLYVARDGEFIGLIGVKDLLRDGVNNALKGLRKNGIERIYLVTGDHHDAAEILVSTSNLDIDEIKANMIPEDKSNLVRALQAQGRRVAVVGDGINDGPALAVADLGIAIKSNGADVAMEAADVVITAENQLELVPEIIKLSRKTMKTIHQNFAFSIGINSIGILLGMLGVISPLTAAILHNASTLGVVFNSSRLYLK
ncbi:MAG TPA: heavy metal translocating P-type ATPase [Candidatus Brocadiales bacterium]|nr:heavy metal translocating P-type ATPase [Candidatus Brocadiales bacterium]